MILGKAHIERLIASNRIIENYAPSLSEDNPAKIDLRLGGKCSLTSRENEIIDLSEDDTIKIKPNDLFLYQTFEKVNMPNDIAGHLSLKMRHTARGLLMSNQTQIDPGYNNYLFGMLYNLSDTDIEIKHGEPIVTLELYQTDNAPGATYSGKMARISFEEFCRRKFGTSLGKQSVKLESTIGEIAELKGLVNKTSEENDKRLNRLMTFVWLATICLMILSAVIAIIAVKPDAEVARLSVQMEYQQQILSRLQKKLELESLNTSPTSPEPGINGVDNENNNIADAAEAAPAQAVE